MNGHERRDSDGGRRDYDERVPLREHLETLIRGVQVQVELELSEVARSVKEADKHCREELKDLRQSVHKLKGDVAGLAQEAANRAAIRKKEREDAATGWQWRNWVPSVVMVAFVAYQVLFQA